MARIETWFDQDLKNPVPVRVLTGSAFSLDNLGNLIGVRVTDGGEVITLSGSVNGYCMLADGQTIPVNGSRSGNMASIVLPQTAYTVPGPIRISIKLTEGSAITTLLACVSTVVRTQTGNIVNPGSVVQDWSTQISAQLQACQDAADNMGAMVAVAFNPSSAYSVGNYVTYQGAMYRITAAHAAGTTWADTSKTQVTVGAELSDLKQAFNDITEETRNLWQNGNINVDSTGYTQFLLKKPLPAGTYTLSGVVTSEATNVTYCVMRFSAVQNPASISTFLTDARIDHTGTRQSVSFTLTETAYTVRMQSSNTVGNSNGFASDWVDLQIESGSIATDYIQPYFPVDLSAIRSSGVMVTANNMASTYSDFDDLPSNEIIGVNAGAIAAGMAHAPTDIGVEVVTFSHLYDDRTGQIAMPFNFATNKYFYLRSLVNHVWTDWVTVNIDKNYVGYDLVSDGTQNNRAADITNILAIKNTCRLGPGDFYVDTVVINAGKTVVGCGNATRIIRLSSSSYKYTVRLTQKSSLSNVALLGSTETISPSSEWNIWDSTNPAVCGVRIEGTGSDDQEFRASIDNVSISGFAGPGIFVRRTGMATSGGCLISNCFVTNCNVGIVLADYAEFHRITGCIFQNNYYGTINNGGNNVFSNCDFSDNVCGALMDNSSGTFGNSSHGAFVGCTFNHIGPVPESGIRSGGNAIELNTMVAGEMFVGCNIFYGNVSLTASQGIVFNSCNFGSQTPLNITGGNVIMFNSCVFRSSGGVNESPLTLTDNTATKVDGCYYLSGREATVETLSA